MIVPRTVFGLARLAAGRIAVACGSFPGIVSPLGWIAAAAALTSGLGAGLLGWSELLYPSFTLAAGLVVAALFLIGRARYRVGIELSPRRVVAGERAFGRLSVVNTGAWRSSAGRLELPVGRGDAGFLIPPLPAGAEHEELFAVPTARRAVIVAGPAVSVRGDQLGLLRRRVRWADPVELFVHPRTVLLSPSAAGLVKDLEGQATSMLSNDDLAFHALRPYQPGDDGRYVHWRTTAPTGTLMVRQFQETRRSDLVLLHSAGRAAYASDDEFELAISITASLGVQLVRDGTCARVVSEQIELRTATVGTLLDDSCRIASIEGSGSLRDFARAAAARIETPSVVIVVTGSAAPIAGLRQVESVFETGTELIALRADLGGEPRLSALSRLRVLTIGELGDLPKLLRRIS